MTSEKIITIVIGLIVGILATGGYFAFQKFVKPAEKIVTRPQPKAVASPSPEVSGAAALTLTVDQPADHSSTTSATITVQGKTAPGASVLIFANADEKIASGDATGKFAVPIKLEEGENEILGTAFLDKVNSAPVGRNVTLEIVQ